MTDSHKDGPAILVDGVSKQFRVPHEQSHTLKERALHPFRRSSQDQFQALDGVSFVVEPGEFFGILGRNGSGKSTLLKCMAGIYRTDAGAIYINGRVSTFIELGVGFNPDLAARDNVMLNAIMLGLTPAQAKERVEKVIEFAELQEFVDLKLKNYSSGMHVRLAFSGMIQVDADILLIDEVLAVGDASFQQKCFDEFNRLRDQRRTMILVTHDVSAVARFCDRAMLIDRGVTVMIDEPRKVGNRYLELNFAQHQSIAAEAVETSPEDREARIVDCWFEDEHGVKTQAVPQGRPTVFKMVVEFLRRCEAPTMGFALEDDQHRVLFATSTLWKGEQTDDFGAGDRAIFAVTFDNPFASGRYFATPTICRSGTVNDFIDRRDRAASVIVRGGLATGAQVQLDHNIVVERDAAAEKAPR